MKEQTLMTCICEIVRQSNNSHLTDEFWSKVSQNTNWLGQQLGLTPTQALLFTILVELSDNKRIELKHIAEFIGCRKVELMGYAADFDELIKRQFIRRRRSHTAEPDTYRVPRMVFDALQEGRVFTPPLQCDLTIDLFFKSLRKLISYSSQHELSQGELVDELQQLIGQNQQLEFCRLFRESAEKLHPWEVVVLAQCCNLYVNDRDDQVGWHDLAELFDDEWAARCVKDALLAHYSDLFDMGLLENAPDGMFGDKETFRLTNKAKSSLLSEILILFPSSNSRKGMLTATSIQPKKLFFDPTRQEQFNRLEQLLCAENFDRVRQRLHTSGMRRGFACLFYGSPGTGKTESVLQLARQTGRDIMQVDIAETKSMWYGESEKQIKEIFDRYRRYVRESDLAPILLFNEADAVLSRRRTSASGSLDQTENTIQNILLEEIEKLDGILIATTNLTQNLDKAFERRFLYKIEFQRPILEVRCAIWQSMIASLNYSEAEELSRAFDLSGGQIENVVRKYTVDYALQDAEVVEHTDRIESLWRFCQEELRYEAGERKRIGY